MGSILAYSLKCGSFRATKINVETALLERQNYRLKPFYLVTKMGSSGLSMVNCPEYGLKSLLHKAFSAKVRLWNTLFRAKACKHCYLRISGLSGFLFRTSRSEELKNVASKEPVCKNTLSF